MCIYTYWFLFFFCRGENVSRAVQPHYQGKQNQPSTISPDPNLFSELSMLEARGPALPPVNEGRVQTMREDLFVSLQQKVVEGGYSYCTSSITSDLHSFIYFCVFL